MGLIPSINPRPQPVEKPDFWERIQEYSLQALIGGLVNIGTRAASQYTEEKIINEDERTFKDSQRDKRETHALNLQRKRHSIKLIENAVAARKLGMDQLLGANETAIRLKTNIARENRQSRTTYETPAKEFERVMGGVAANDKLLFGKAGPAKLSETSLEGGAQVLTETEAQRQVEFEKALQGRSKTAKLAATILGKKKNEIEAKWGSVDKIPEEAKEELKKDLTAYLELAKNYKKELDLMSDQYLSWGIHAGTFDDDDMEAVKIIFGELHKKSQARAAKTKRLERDKGLKQEVPEDLPSISETRTSAALVQGIGKRESVALVQQAEHDTRVTNKPLAAQIRVNYKYKILETALGGKIGRLSPKGQTYNPLNNSTHVESAGGSLWVVIDDPAFVAGKVNKGEMNLTRGLSGAPVADLQKQLKSLSIKGKKVFPTLEVTGNYDAKTEAAVKVFQTHLPGKPGDMTPTGQVDAITARTLKEFQKLNKREKGQIRGLLDSTTKLGDLPVDLTSLPDSPEKLNSFMSEIEGALGKKRARVELSNLLERDYTGAVEELEPTELKSLSTVIADARDGLYKVSGAQAVLDPATGEPYQLAGGPLGVFKFPTKIPEATFKAPAPRYSESLGKLKTGLAKAKGRVNTKATLRSANSYFRQMVEIDPSSADAKNLLDNEVSLSRVYDGLAVDLPNVKALLASIKLMESRKISVYKENIDLLSKRNEEAFKIFTGLVNKDDKFSLASLDAAALQAIVENLDIDTTQDIGGVREKVKAQMLKHSEDNPLWNKDENGKTIEGLESLEDFTDSVFNLVTDYVSEIAQSKGQMQEMFLGAGKPFTVRQGEIAGRYARTFVIGQVFAEFEERMDNTFAYMTPEKFDTYINQEPDLGGGRKGASYAKLAKIAPGDTHEQKKEKIKVYFTGRLGDEINSNKNVSVAIDAGVRSAMRDTSTIDIGRTFSNDTSHLDPLLLKELKKKEKKGKLQEMMNGVRAEVLRRFTRKTRIIGVRALERVIGWSPTLSVVFPKEVSRYQ